MRGLEGKVALVTGAASGLGKAIALRLASEGTRVVITDVQPRLGHETAAESGLMFLKHNVVNEEHWDEVVRETEQRFGALNILVNNAGIAGATEGANPEDARLEDWNTIFAVNVGGVFLGCRTGIPAMRRAGGGSIINVSSVAALLATPEHMAYGASKAAVTQMTKSVAQYCAQEKLNIRCNSVHPGNVQTAIWERHSKERAKARGVSVDDVLAEAAARVPLGDWTRAEDVAGAVAFLASDDARHITGDKLSVDGGLVNCDTFLRTVMASALANRDVP